MQLKLYHYWRSSCSWRVRWALALKKMECDFEAVNLLKKDQQSDRYLEFNPLGVVPALTITTVNGSSQTHTLTESVAMMEWLEEVQPEPSILPGPPLSKARIRQLTEVIVSGTQPMQNLGVQQAVSDDKQRQQEWARRWITRGLTAYERLLLQDHPFGPGVFSVGDQLSMADLALIPQCYNALRFNVELEEFPIISRIRKAALEHPSYEAAAPDRFAPET